MYLRCEAVCPSSAALVSILRLSENVLTECRNEKIAILIARAAVIKTQFLSVVRLPYLPPNRK